MSKAIIWPVKVGYTVVDQDTLEQLSEGAMDKKEAMHMAFEFNMGWKSRTPAEEEIVEEVVVTAEEPAPVKPKRRARKKK